MAILSEAFSLGSHGEPPAQSTSCSGLLAQQSSCCFLPQHFDEPSIRRTFGRNHVRHLSVWYSYNLITCWTATIYDKTTPVCAGEMEKRVATVRMATMNVKIVPRQLRRIPSHCWFVTVNQYALYNKKDISHWRYRSTREFVTYFLCPCVPCFPFRIDPFHHKLEWLPNLINSRRSARIMTNGGLHLRKVIRRIAETARFI